MRVLIHMPDPGFQKTALLLGFLARTLGLGSQITHTEAELFETAVLCREHGSFFIVIGDALQIPLMQKLYRENPYARVLVLIGEEFLKSREVMLSCAEFNHFLPLMNNVPITEAVLTTLQRMSRKEYWSLTDYLKRPCYLNSTLLSSSKDRDDALEQMSSQLKSLGQDFAKPLMDRTLPRILSMVEELLLNAVFAAHPKFQKSDGSDGFELPFHESVRFEWGLNGQILGISVTDPFGALKRDSFFKNILGSEKEDSLHSHHSLGHGLKSLIRHAHTIIANVSPGARTSIHVFLNFEASLKSADERPKQIEYYLC